MIDWTDWYTKQEINRLNYKMKSANEFKAYFNTLPKTKRSILDTMKYDRKSYMGYYYIRMNSDIAVFMRKDKKVFGYFTHGNADQLSPYKLAIKHAKDSTIIYQKHNKFRHQPQEKQNMKLLYARIFGV